MLRKSEYEPHIEGFVVGYVPQGSSRYRSWFGIRIFSQEYLKLYSRFRGSAEVDKDWYSGFGSRSSVSTQSSMKAIQGSLQPDVTDQSFRG
jgi:hypothetical protein